MHIHINRIRRQRQKQHRHRISATRQGVAIAGPDRPNQRPVLHRPAIDEQEYIGSCRPVHRWQSGKTGQLHIIAHRIQHRRFGRKAAPHDRGNTRRNPVIARRGGGQIQHRAPIGGQVKAHCRPCHCQAADHIDTLALFGSFGFEKFQTRRNHLEQSGDRNHRPFGQGGRLWTDQFAPIDHEAPRVIHRGLNRCQTQTRYRSN